MYEWVMTKRTCEAVQNSKGIMTTFSSPQVYIYIPGSHCCHSRGRCWDGSPVVSLCAPPPGVHSPGNPALRTHIIRGARGYRQLAVIGRAWIIIGGILRTVTVIQEAGFVSRYILVSILCPQKHQYFFDQNHDYLQLYHTRTRSRIYCICTHLVSRVQSIGKHELLPHH